jgi:hypothetical protein
MIEELIARVFAIRNAAHLAHWKIKSGYNHETLGTFYDEVIEKADRIVEANIAIFEAEVPDGLPALKPVKDIVVQMEDDLLWIGKNRKELGGKVPAIDNMLQDLEGTYIDALFKLKNLS